MLFFRRRDTTASQSNLTDQERCIHICLFFAFILLGLTVALFYFAVTHKGPNDQRLFYYIGAGVSVAMLFLIIFITIVFVRRSYGYSSSSSSSARSQDIATHYDQPIPRYSNYR